MQRLWQDARGEGGDMPQEESSRPLLGKVAMVAGATRGAGRAIAVELARAGAYVYATGRSSRVHGRSEIDRPETIEETGELMERADGEDEALRVDHLEPDEVGALVGRIEREQDRLDILVNDIFGGDRYAEWDKKLWDHDVNGGLRMLRMGIETHLITCAKASASTTTSSRRRSSGSPSASPPSSTAPLARRSRSRRAGCDRSGCSRTSASPRKPGATRSSRGRTSASPSLRRMSRAESSRWLRTRTLRVTQEGCSRAQSWRERTASRTRTGLNPIAGDTSSRSRRKTGLRLSSGTAEGTFRRCPRLSWPRVPRSSGQLICRGRRRSDSLLP